MAACDYAGDFGYCNKCRAKYAVDHAIPPCDKTGKCPLRGGKPPIKLDYDDYVALEIYLETLSISPHNMSGLPSLAALDVIMMMCGLNELPWQDRTRLMNKIMSIHNIYYPYLVERLKSEGNSDAGNN